MSYAPPGESADDLWLERSNNDGLTLGGFCYGILFTLSVQCIEMLYYNRRSSKAARPLLFYTGLMLALGTVAFGGNAKFNELTYIGGRGYPGGPNAYTVDFYNHPINMSSFASYIMMGWLGDGLVLYRFFLLWNFSYRMFIGPAMIYIASVVMSIALMIAISKGSFWTDAAVKFGVAYWSLSISLNVILTLLISGRLWYFRRRIKAVLGAEHTSTYTSVLSMLVESAALYSITLTIFVISYARGSAFQNVVLPPFGMISGIAPILIIFRVAKGKAWSQDNFNTQTGSTGRFVNRSGLTSKAGNTTPTVMVTKTTVTDVDYRIPITSKRDSGSYLDLDVER
ncbi:hypothetical protein BDQ17DRAFT_1299432 [Cyathus striatus]|nr:hypothetical protein BDQ17DRAFT_1299432 [Cyathus striatus]